MSLSVFPKVHYMVLFICNQIFPLYHEHHTLIYFFIPWIVSARSCPTLCRQRDLLHEDPVRTSRCLQCSLFLLSSIEMSIHVTECSPSPPSPPASRDTQVAPCPRGLISTSKITCFQGLWCILTNCISERCFNVVSHVWEFVSSPVCQTLIIKFS